MLENLSSKVCLSRVEYKKIKMKRRDDKARRTADQRIKKVMLMNEKKSNAALQKAGKETVRVAAIFLIPVFLILTILSFNL